MNKKRRILTIVALALFSAIILFHYVRWTVITWPWTEMRDVTTDDISIERIQGNKVTILSDRFKRDYPSGYSLWLYKAKIEGPLRFDVGRPAIKDIRMPLFVLAVFYAGLFFILGEQNPRN